VDPWPYKIVADIQLTAASGEVEALDAIPKCQQCQ
jgi:hypothetical protein